jgi:hypothetical protein
MQIIIRTILIFCIVVFSNNEGLDSRIQTTEGIKNRNAENQSSTFPVFPGGVLAFPGAEGYGRNATGGREGEIYHVTNLNDDGKGSFRDAVSKPGRIIVFDVSGIIKLSSTPVQLQSNQTILAQTAPGDGVVLYGGRLSASGAHNTIVRYLRVRMGVDYSGKADAAGMANGFNVIFDHCSFTWGKDENFSISTNNRAPLENITIQNSIIGHGLQNHSCGGLMQTGITEGVTIFRNLYIDNHTRNPKVKGLNQFVNNVVYNWGGGTAYDMGGNSKGPSETTIEDNYFIVGPAETYRDTRQSDGTVVTKHTRLTPSKPFTGGNALFRTFWKGNYYDDNKDGAFNGRPMDWEKDCSGNPLFLDTPSNLHPQIVSQTTAETAYKWIVENVGATLPRRDQVDAYLIGELTSLGTKGTIIKNETDTAQFPLGGPGVIKPGTKPLDTDGDGISDAFEDKWGLDKNDPSDAMMIASNGYTNIENYSFSLEYPENYK